ncbi:MAG: FliA/WhiG family RNA polymerase sigma factor [Balneolaceae bacterium]
MQSASLQQLIELYFSDPTDGLRHAIITKSIPLVRSILGKIPRPDHPLSDLQDLESVGINGVLQAIESYDPSKGIQFNTFAYYRIRGSMIDYLRMIDQLPRNQRSSYGKVQETMARLSQELGREPLDQEVADSLEMTLSSYHTLLSSVQQRNALSLDQSGSGENPASIYDFFADESTPLPDQELEEEELLQQLATHVQQLPEKERLILTLYFYEDLTMSEIALLLDRTEARVSQIIGKILLRLRAAMKNPHNAIRPA